MKRPSTLSTHVFDSPVGPLFAAVDEDRALVRLQFLRGTRREELEAGLEARGHDVRGVRSHAVEVERQLKAYFRGKRTRFELDLRPGGTPFQQRVWKAVTRIPYGETSTYGELAREVRSPRAVRAVGRCNALNPIVLVVPCHRVIGSDGSLTGYGGGLDAKRLLLELEAGAPV
jgi:methylated-DNA-[protein]-cysteine S-methyltransferase